MGRFTIAAADAPAVPIRLSARKARALLAILATSPGQAAPRDQLATLLWGSSPEPHARHSLSQAIAVLRRELNAPHLLQADDEVIELSGDVLSTDAVELETLSTAATLDDLERAVVLLRGEFLEGLVIAEEGFQDWLDQQRRRYGLVAARVLEAYALRCDEAGQGERAIGAVERLMALDPLREDWHRLALRLYAGCRGAGAAMARAKDFAAVLRRELDVEPEDATRALIQEIQDAASAPCAPPGDPGAARLRPARDRSAVVTAQPSAPAAAQVEVASARPAAAWRQRPSLMIAAIASVIVIAAGVVLSLAHGRLVPAPGGDQGLRAAVDKLNYDGFAALTASSERGAASLKQAEDYFLRALARDPNSVTAIRGLGAYHALMGALALDDDPQSHLTKAETYLWQAIRDGPQMAAAYYFMGIVQEARREWRQAIDSYEHALELSPGYAPVHAQIGHALIAMGRAREGIDKVQYALRLSPSDPHRVHWLRSAAQGELELGHYEEAIALLDRSYAINPRQPLTLRALAAAHALSGHVDEAGRYVAELDKLTPPAPRQRLLGAPPGLEATQPELARGLQLVRSLPR
jgi:DNA-binding SARP family transcriptional activator/Tfp pilus assembly protein PilF